MHHVSTAPSLLQKLTITIGIALLICLGSFFLTHQAQAATASEIEAQIESLVTQMQTAKGTKAAQLEIQITALMAQIAALQDESEEDSLYLESSDEDPDATTISLSKDTNVEATIFAFDLSAEDSDNDIEIWEIGVDVAITKAKSLDNIVNDFRLEINGESYDAESYKGTNNKVTLIFEIDGDTVIDAGDVVTAILFADFDNMQSTDEGSTIVASVNPKNIEGEGYDDITASGKTLKGETHTLRSESMDVEYVDSDTDVVEGKGINFNMQFEVTAIGDDICVPTSPKDALRYFILNPNGGAVAVTGKTTVALSSSADEEGKCYEISDGDTEEFSVDVFFTPIESGSYRLMLDTLFSDMGEYDLNDTDFQTNLVTFSKVTTPVPTSGITVTAPNGGEKWDSGVLNTVTWTPYNYNPDVNPSKDVTAYLEIKAGNGQFSTVGKVEESGKASIHWITGELYSDSAGTRFATPGNGYYIRVINNKTGKWDRSDAPFTLLPKPITLLVNGSEDFVTIPDVKTPITLSWKTTPGVSKCQVSGIKGVKFGTVQPNTGSVKGTVEYQVLDERHGGGISYDVRIQCVKNGAQIEERAKLNIDTAPQVKASLRIMSPNGGERIDPSKQMDIMYTTVGIRSLSVALYKDDQWRYWIAKDVPVTGEGKTSISWTPSTVLQNLGDGNNKKIYITGQKSDGTGYIDDKSDAPFSFIAQTPVPTIPPINLEEAVGFGVYEGIGQASSWNNHPEQTVYLEVPVTASGKVLVLSAYEPVNWVLRNPNKVMPSRIILAGYYAQRVTSIDNIGYVPDSYYYGNMGGKTAQFAYTNSDTRFSDFKTWLATKGVNLVSNNFIGAYSAKDNVLFRNTVTPSAPVAVPVTPAPTMTLAINPTTVKVGESATLTWNSKNATSCSGLPTYDTISPSGSQVIVLGEALPSKTYIITCVGNGGKVSKSVTVMVTPAPVVTAPVAPTSVYTISASPASGVAPLKTTLTVSTKVCAGELRRIVYGDGTTENFGGCNPINTTTNPQLTTRTYTYTKVGTYTAEIQKQVSGVWEKVSETKITVTEPAPVVETTPTTMAVPTVPSVLSVNAGADSYVMGSNAATISGAKASDANGGAVTLVWKNTAKPAGAAVPTITRGTTLTPTFSGFTTPGIYQFSLTATGADGVSKSDTMQMTVIVSLPGYLLQAPSKSSLTSSEAIKLQNMASILQALQELLKKLPR